jgi:hypothetical protein
MNVAPRTSGGGLLPPIHAVHHVTISPPFAGPGPVLLDAVAAELQRHGNRVRRPAPRVVEFDGPGLFYFGFSFRRKAAVLVSGGTVTLDPAAPASGVRLDLRYNPWLTYAWPCLVLALMLVQPAPLGFRALVLLVAGIACLVNYALAAGAYIAWVGRAAADARPRPGG